MTPLAFEPLSDEELDELDHFMLHEVDCGEGMTLDMLDGYLHAIAIGPKNLMPRQWMPAIWGEGDSMMPPVESIEKLNRILGLIMRMFNSIITGLEDDSRGVCGSIGGVSMTMQKDGPTGLLKACTCARLNGVHFCRALMDRLGIARLAC